MTKLCRTCLLKDVEANNENKYNIISYNIKCGEEILEISHMIYMCAGLKILLNDEYSNEICDRCLDDLKSAYLFRQKCWHSEKSLKSSHDKNQFEVKAVEISSNSFKSDASNSADSSFECEDQIGYNSDSSSEYESQDSLPLAAAFCGTNVEKIMKISQPVSQVDPIADCSSDVIDSMKNESDVEIKDELKTEIFVAPLVTVVPKKLKIRKSKAERADEAKEKRAVQRKKDKEMGPRMCDVCGRILSSPKTLQMHKKCVHANELKYACHICPYRGNRKANLTAHMRTHTGERPYACEDCGKTFPTQGAKIVHRKSHFDDKPYVCNICNKAFKKKGLLNAHKYGHDDSRRVPCQYCNKGFFKEQLRNHEMTHTDERPYTCEFCTNGFIQKSYFKRHRKECEEKFKNGTLVIKKKILPRPVNKYKRKPKSKKFEIETAVSVPKEEGLQDICLEMHIQGNVSASTSEMAKLNF